MKKLILYGAGETGRKWSKKLGDNVFCFVDRDSNKIGTKIDGKEVLGINELLDFKEEYVLFISTQEKYKKEIEDFLIEMNLKDKIITTPYWEKDNKIHLQAVTFNTKMEGKNFIGSNSAVLNSNLGYGTYIANRTNLQNVKIGKFTAIGSNVCNIIGQHPTSQFVSIHPAFYSIDNSIGYSLVSRNKFQEMRYSEEKYSVSIGNDVWIGNNVQIMEGVTIADGSIIGAGAVVIHDTEPYSINAGVPAKKIRYRFKQEVIEKLCDLKWWDRDISWIEKNAELFENVEEFLQHVQENNEN